MPETAKQLSAGLGRSIEYVQIPIADVRKNSEDFALMLEWFERVGYNADIAGAGEGIRREVDDVRRVGQGAERVTVATTTRSSRPYLIGALLWFAGALVLVGSGRLVGSARRVRNWCCWA